MKEKVEIILRSVQRNEEEENETELRTEGVYEHDGKNWSVSYEESEATGFEDSTTEITGTDGRCVSIVRRGSANSNLMIETGEEKAATSMFLGGANPGVVVGISIAVVALCFVGSVVGMLVSRELKKAGVLKK